MNIAEFKFELLNYVSNDKKLGAIQFIKKHFDIGLRECKDLLEENWTWTDKDLLVRVVTNKLKEYPNSFFWIEDGGQSIDNKQPITLLNYYETRIRYQKGNKTYKPSKKQIADFIKILEGYNIDKVIILK